MKLKNNVFLTGGEGFIGGALRHDFNKKKVNVFLVDTAKKNHTLKYPLEFSIDINNLVDSSAFDLSEGTFIHTAGIANVRFCENNPSEAFEANVELTKSCLKAALKFGCKKFIFLSTGFVYGDKTNRPHKEIDPTFSNNVYLKTKIQAEKIVKEFSVNNDIKTIILRLGNVYGFGTSKETVIGRIISQINLGNKTIEIFSTKPIRDFIYIEDICDAIHRIVNSETVESYQTYNLSFGKGVSIKNIIDILQNAENSFCVSESKPNQNQSVLILNTEKFKNTFDWEPRYDITLGLKKYNEQYNDKKENRNIYR